MFVSSPADETRDAAERRLGRCAPPPLSSRYITYDEVEVSDAYLAEAQQLAGEVETLSEPGDKHWDLAQYTSTIIREVYRQRNRVAFLEGWKEATEAAVEHVKRA